MAVLHQSKESRWRFVLGMVLGFAVMAIGLSLLGFCHFERVPRRINIPEDPMRAQYRRLRAERDRFYAEVGRPPEQEDAGSTVTP